MTNERIRELMVEVMTNTKKGHEEAHKAIKALGYEIKLDDGVRRFVISNPITMRSVSVWDGWRPKFEIKGARVDKGYVRRVDADKIKKEVYDYRGKQNSFITYRLNSHFDIVNFLNTDRKVDNVQPSKYAQARWKIEFANKSIKSAENMLDEERRDFERMVKHHEERMEFLYKNLANEKAETMKFKDDIMADIRNKK